MADLTFKKLRAKFDTRLNDTGDKLLASTLKDEFVLEALGDPYVYIIDRDKTTTTVAGKAEYPIPAQFSEVVDIAIDINGNGYSHGIDPSAYKTVNGIIIFDPYYISLPAGKNLIIYGKAQLDNTSTIPTFLQEYVLQMSMISAWEYLAAKLADSFLTNDMSMADLLNKIAYHTRRATALRATLQNRYMQRI
jgi:hypothetical protein